MILIAASGCNKESAEPPENDEDCIVHLDYFFEDSKWVYHYTPDDDYNMYKKSLNSSDNIRIMEWDSWPFCVDREWIYFRDVPDNFSL